VVVASPGMRKWLAVGTGAGIEAGPEDLRIAVVRVRPSGKRLLTTFRVERYLERPASEWGAELAAGLRSAKAANYPVTVLLPRQEVIVRLISMPGVADSDLASALSYQMEGLHPYPEGEAAFCWARLPGTEHVLAGITRQEVIDRYSNLFAEAGVRVASLTFSAVVLYGAFRVHNVPPAGFLSLIAHNGTVEAYGESPSRPVFAGLFERPAEEIAPLVRNELRLDDEAPALPVDGLLGLGVDAEMSLAASAAIANACPRLSLDANLLPVERRAQISRFRYVPTAALAALLLVTLAVVSAQPGYQEQRLLKQMEAEIAKVEKQASQVAAIEKAIQEKEERLGLLGRFQARSRADADSLLEVTNLVAPPGWVQFFQLTREQVQLTGETEQAAPLLKLLDGSERFRDSQFSQPMSKTASGSESFIIQAGREGLGTGREAEGGK